MLATNCLDRVYLASLCKKIWSVEKWSCFFPWVDAGKDCLNSSQRWTNCFCQGCTWFRKTSIIFCLTAIDKNSIEEKWFEKVEIVLVCFLNCLYSLDNSNFNFSWRAWFKNPVSFKKERKPKETILGNHMGVKLFIDRKKNILRERNTRLNLHQNWFPNYI